MKTQNNDPGMDAGDAGNADNAGHEAEGETVDSPELLTRRAFLNRVGIGLSGVAAALVGVPVIGFLLAPLFQQSPEVWRPVGPVSQFKVGETVEVKFEDASP